MLQQPMTDNTTEAEEREAREAKRRETIRRDQAAIEILTEWQQGDAEKQRATWEAIEVGLRRHPITFRTGEP